MAKDIRYRPSPTGARFHQSNADVRALMGPVGSGKSVTCTVEAYRRMSECQSSRGLVVRNTYRELSDTTLNTWMDWLRPYGTFSHGTMTHTLNIEGTHHEVLFRALDRPGDIGKLLSLELTWAWLNEYRELAKPIFNMLKTRIGRYPARREYGDNVPPFFGIWMDTNPPDDLHWSYRLFEELRPDGHELFRQPGGLSDAAENVHNLVPGYYQRISAGQDQAWIDVYVNGQYGFIVDGKPIYPQYNDLVHCAAQPLEVLDSPVFVGVDFGLTPAATFKQLTADGQWQCSGEVVTEDFSALEFAPLLGETLRRNYAGLPVTITGDPSGNRRSEADKNTPFLILRAAGIIAHQADTNDPDIRQGAVIQHLQRLTMTGEPGYIISPTCKYLRRGYMGGYKYKLMQVTGDVRYHLEPDKNIYSHVCEADQYGFLGAGQGKQVIGTPVNKPLDYTKRDEERRLYG